MIDYKFIRKKFSNKLLLFFLIVSLIPSIFIVFYNSNKVYQFKINLKKIEVINNFGLEPNNFIEKITDNSNILIKPINNYTKFIPENFHTLNNNNLYIYLRKKDILDYYLDIVTKIDLDPRDIIIFLKKKN